MINTLVKCTIASCSLVWAACAAAQSVPQSGPKLSEIFRVELYTIAAPDADPALSSLPALPAVSGGFSDDSHYVVWGIANMLCTVNMTRQSAQNSAIDDLAWVVPSSNCRMWVLDGQAAHLTDIPTRQKIETITVPNGLLKVRRHGEGLVACTDASIEVLRQAKTGMRGANAGGGPSVAWEWTSTRSPGVMDVESAFGSIVAYEQRTPSSGRLHVLESDGSLRGLAEVVPQAMNVECGLSCDDKRVIVTGFGFRVFRPGANEAAWTRSKELRLVKRVHLMDDQHALVAMEDGLEVAELAGAWMPREVWKCPGRVLDLAWCSLSKKCCVVFQLDLKIHSVVLGVR